MATNEHMALSTTISGLHELSDSDTANPGARICLSITHGFQARNLLQTDVLPLLLSAGHRITIVSPAGDRPEFQEAFARPGVSFIQASATPNWLATWFGIIRRYALANPRRNATYNLFNEDFLRSRKPRYVLLRALNRVLGRFPALRHAWMGLESLLMPGRSVDDVFESDPPGLLVTGTPGTEHLDALLLRAARRHGVPTLCVVLSWDNLTSKGHMAVRPDRLVVWNERMRDEAIELHDYPPDTVDVAGVAHFDVYARPEEHLTGEQVRQRLGLDACRRTVVFGTVSPILFRYNHEIAECIARAMVEGRIRLASQLVIRLHPQSISGKYADDLERYYALQRRYSEVVVLDLPRVLDSGMQWALPGDEMRWLASLLRHADVALTVGSTFAIDAALCDTPIIGVAFDGFHHLEYHRSIRRAYDYTHYLPVVASGGLPIAESETEMVTLINRYLEEPSLDREGRARIVREQAWQVDGRSGERVAGLIDASVARVRR